jgi:hypothetical protein
MDGFDFDALYPHGWMLWLNQLGDEEMFFLVARDRCRPFAEQQFVRVKASHDEWTRGDLANILFGENDNTRMLRLTRFRERDDSAKRGGACEAHPAY